MLNLSSPSGAASTGASLTLPEHAAWRRKANFHATKARKMAITLGPKHEDVLHEQSLAHEAAAEATRLFTHDVLQLSKEN